MTSLYRSIETPRRTGLSTAERWVTVESGLIYCWERGREKRAEDPVLAARAERGELPTLAWSGGVKEPLKAKEKFGSLHYLATWQGLRGEDLNIPMKGEYRHTCNRFDQLVVFSADWRERRKAAGAEDEDEDEGEAGETGGVIGSLFGGDM